MSENYHYSFQRISEKNRIICKMRTCMNLKISIYTLVIDKLCF